jgi:hypothetical protein
MGGAYRQPAPPLFATMSATGQAFDGSWMRAAGLPMPPLRAEGAVIFLIERAVV